MRKALIVGCGLSGSVIARELAEHNHEVTILEQRNHIGGNLYDYRDEHGILVHKYGPHTFHTNDYMLYNYLQKYCSWVDYKLTCGAVINGVCTPTPFNYKTIDEYFSLKKAQSIKEEFSRIFPERSTVTVVEALNCNSRLIYEYAKFLFDNDYSLYTSKQWGVSPSEIDSSVLKRVPLRLGYDNAYFDDIYQIMPRESYISFFNKLLDHSSITIELNVNALEHLKIEKGELFYNGVSVDCPVIYTGAIDELFGSCYGALPYRSLRFDWKYENIESRQEMAVVAYPQDPEIIRIVEYKKLPYQNVEGTSYEIEYSLPYIPGNRNEPYYPLLTQKSMDLYDRYRFLSSTVRNLYVCGRLGDFRYYNMDQALKRAMEISKNIIESGVKNG